MRANKVLDSEEQKKKYRQVISRLVSKAVEDVESGKITVKSVEDVESLAKLNVLILEKPTKGIFTEYDGTMFVKQNENGEKL